MRPFPQLTMLNRAFLPLCGHFCRDPRIPLEPVSRDRGRSRYRADREAALPLGATRGAPVGTSRGRSGSPNVTGSTRHKPSRPTEISLKTHSLDSAFAQSTQSDSDSADSVATIAAESRADSAD